MLRNDVYDVSYIKSDLRLYKDLFLIGNINNTELNNNTTNLATISDKIKYITCANGNTVVNSSIYIQHYNNPSDYVCKLANDYNQLSYTLSNLTISGNVAINGKITNTEVNNNTTNIVSISGLISTANNNITTNTTNIATLSGLISNINNNNNLGNVITVQGTAATGYTINIGNALSKVYINGDLYYNGDLMLRRDFSDGNQVGIDEFINEIGIGMI